MPQLSLDSDITMREISGITRLSPDRPVFLIVADDHSNIVLKQENSPTGNDAKNLRFANKAMGAVSADAKGKVLTDAELGALKDYAELEMLIAEVGQQTVPADLLAFSQFAAAAGQPWYKMKKAEGILSLEEAVTRASNNGDKSLVRQIANALNVKNGLETLGRIVAADFFNANTDRFNVLATLEGGEGAKNPRVKGARFDVLVNIGNVLLSVQQTVLRPIGLDMYEASQHFRNIDKSVAELEAHAAGGEQWSGRRLLASEAGFRKEFAKAMCNDLEQAWGPRNRKIAWGSKTRLVMMAYRRVARGMDLGIAEMSARLGKWRTKPGCPAGLVDRLNVLGW